MKRAHFPVSVSSLSMSVEEGSLYFGQRLARTGQREWIACYKSRHINRLQGTDNRAKVIAIPKQFRPTVLTKDILFKEKESGMPLDNFPKADDGSPLKPHFPDDSNDSNTGEPKEAKDSDSEKSVNEVVENDINEKIAFNACMAANCGELENKEKEEADDDEVDSSGNDFPGGTPVRNQKMDAETKRKIIKAASIGAVAVLGAAVTPFAVVGVLGAVGFGAGGVLAGSIAAGIQSAVYGGAVASGSAFAICQSIGAAGLGVAGAATSAAAGGGVFGGIAAGCSKLFGNNKRSSSAAGCSKPFGNNERNSDKKTQTVESDKEEETVHSSALDVVPTDEKKFKL